MKILHIYSSNWYNTRD